MGNQLRPLFSESISAGFPSPAQDYIEQTIDLNSVCIRHPAATYFLRVSGDSMVNIGIHNNDLLVVDRSITASHSDIVVATIGGDFTVKELCLKPVPMLIAHNDDYLPIHINDNSDFQIFGVVVHVIKDMRKRST